MTIATLDTTARARRADPVDMPAKLPVRLDPTPKNNIREALAILERRAHVDPIPPQRLVAALRQWNRAARKRAGLAVTLLVAVGLVGCAGGYDTQESTLPARSAKPTAVVRAVDTAPAAREDAVVGSEPVGGETAATSSPTPATPEPAAAPPATTPDAGGPAVVVPVSAPAADAGPAPVEPTVPTVPDHSVRVGDYCSDPVECESGPYCWQPSGSDLPMCCARMPLLGGDINDCFGVGIAAGAVHR